MEFSFIEALRGLGPNAAVRIANAVRPPESYLFNTILPERTDTEYDVSSAYMTVRTTMAGLAGMDSPYPESGLVELSDFNERTAKVANQATLPEEALRKLQGIIMRLLAQGQPTIRTLQAEILNFLNKVILQAHLDTAEWMRGQALVTGAIDWTFNKKRIYVSYGIPSANILTNRTGNDAWTGSASKFWTDIRLINRYLRYNLRALIMHPDTLDAVISNTVNSMEIISAANGIYELQRIITVNGLNVPSSDRRDRIRIITYGYEGEVYSLSTPGTTVKIPYMAMGKILGVANNFRSDYRVGEGATDNPRNDEALGYTHIGPTVEGGGAAGRWANLYTPEHMPMQLVGRGVTNILPVIENPEKIVVASSDIS